MRSLVNTYSIWLAVVFGIGTAPLFAAEPEQGLERFAAAMVHPPQSFDSIGYFAPDNVAKLHLTAPAASEVLINGVRTRSAGRDRYFQIPIAQTEYGTVRPTRVEVLLLSHQGTGKPDVNSYIDYELYLIGGTTTRLTAKPKIDPAATDHSFVNMMTPFDDDRESLPPPEGAKHPSAVDCPERYTATIEVRYKDDDNEENRTPRLLNWVFNPNPEILINHGVHFDSGTGCKVTDVSLTYKLYSISADPKTSETKQLGAEHRIREQDIQIHPNVASADIQKHLQIAISENLLLRHNAERVVAKDWTLKFKLNEKTTCESKCETLKYEIRIASDFNYQ